MTETLPDRTDRLSDRTETVPDVTGRLSDRSETVPDVTGRLSDRSETLPVRALDADGYRRALAVHAAGVVVITAQADGIPVGLTATSFSSVSLDPPLVSFYVDRSSTTWPWLRSADHFAVNVLASDQAELAARFACRDIDRFAEPTRWRPGALGAPLLQDVSAHLICLPDQTVDVGDHILVVGLVAEATVHRPGRPLLYHQGSFGRFVAHPRPRVAGPTLP